MAATSGRDGPHGVREDVSEDQLKNGAGKHSSTTSSSISSRSPAASASRGDPHLHAPGFHRLALPGPLEFEVDLILTGR